MMLQLDSVRKRFGDFCAVDGVTFGVESGTIYGLLGPNGAGKTTIIRMIMGILLPDEGGILVRGRPLDRSIKDMSGYLPEERGLYRKMKVFDLLSFFGRSHGLSAQETARRIRFWLDRMELSDRAGKRIEELSKGMQQKIQFISTVMHEPQILIMDELFSGLDPINSCLLKDTLLELSRKGATILFSTHNMEEAEKLCHSICLINKGRIVVSGELRVVKESYGQNTILVEAKTGLSALQHLDYVERADLYENYAEIRLKNGNSPSRLLCEIAGKMDVRKFEIVEPTLRSIFVDLVKGGSRGL
jgi:ABC-2 type transport system ATP-binding protein